MGAGKGKPFTADLAQFTPLTMRIGGISFTTGFLHPFQCVQTIILPCLETETLIAVLHQIEPVSSIKKTISARASPLGVGYNRLHARR
jgi:hypothetical protein